MTSVRAQRSGLRGRPRLGAWSRSSKGSRSRSRGVPFVKGHGTQNDFVLLVDPDGALELSAELVRAVCDRHRGLGADGVLRVVRTAKSLEPDVEPLADDAEWFMDYRNADGSLSEMCGNGVRVYVALSPRVRARRRPERSGGDAGRRTARARRGRRHDRGRHGRRRSLRGDGVASVTVGDRTWSGARPRGAQPARRRASSTTSPTPAPCSTRRSRDRTARWPDGVNVEFVRIDAPGHLAMRVYERGVGETRSCGTGACAAVVAARRHLGADAPARWDVDVPGGRLRVTDGRRRRRHRAGRPRRPRRPRHPRPRHPRLTPRTRPWRWCSGRNTGSADGRRGVRPWTHDD